MSITSHFLLAYKWSIHNRLKSKTQILTRGLCEQPRVTRCSQAILFFLQILLIFFLLFSYLRSMTTPKGKKSKHNKSRAMLNTTKKPPYTESIASNTPSFRLLLRRTWINFGKMCKQLSLLQKILQSPFPLTVLKSSISWIFCISLSVYWSQPSNHPPPLHPKHQHNEAKSPTVQSNIWYTIENALPRNHPQQGHRDWRSFFFVGIRRSSNGLELLLVFFGREIVVAILDFRLRVKWKLESPGLIDDDRWFMVAKSNGYDVT